MKKLFIIAVVLITGITANKVSAQTGPLPVTTTLNVTLDAVQSITVKDPTVALDFKTSDDYLIGVTAIQTNHLTFASTSGFSITVKADGDLMPQGTATGALIPINTVKIKPTGGTIGALPSGGTGIGAETPLEKTATTIYTSGSAAVGTGGTLQSSLNINYEAKGVDGTEYLNRTGKFSGKITYTIAPH